MVKPENLLQLNIYDKIFQDKLLIIGSCIPRLYPNVFKKFEKKWGNVVSVCMEQTHYNQIFSKVIDILALGQTQKVGFLTVDRSPHCVQLHYMSKYLKKALKVTDIEYSHFVISEDKTVTEVTMEQINDSRNFSKIGKKYKK